MGFTLLAKYLFSLIGHHPLIHIKLVITQLLIRISLVHNTEVLAPRNLNCSCFWK